MSDEIIEPTATSDNSLVAAWSYAVTKTKVKFDESFLKQDKITYTYGTIVNICNVYELS